MRLQDIIMREAPSAYIFDSDGTVHRTRQFDLDEPLVNVPAVVPETSAPLKV